jgi:hypothetical protein
VLCSVSGIGPTLSGRSGKGDPHSSDGDIHFAVPSPGAAPAAEPPTTLPDSALIKGRNQIWSGMESRFGPAVPAR